jgi:polyisoprenoid-binding protein YceI
MTTRSRWLRWMIAGAVVIGVLAVGGPFVYIHLIEGPAPAPLGLRSPADPSATKTGGTGTRTTTGSTVTPVAGAWSPGTGSVVGYRVKEVLLGQDNLAVGRSHAVTGKVTISGTTVTSATFTVQMATMRSDESQRDAQFDGRIMDVFAYPTGTFALSSPIKLAPLPAIGAVRAYSAAGNLTLHGHTRPVTFRLSAERTTTAIKVSGIDPGRVRRLEHPEPQLRQLRHHAEPRHTRVPDRAQKDLTAPARSRLLRPVQIP